MARFERKGKRGPPRRDSRGGRGSRDSYSDRGRGSDRGYSRDRNDIQKTKVTCSSCGEKCEVPFKPTSNKPVYCDNCYSKKDKGGSGKDHSKDFAIINEKLDKILEILESE
tara:strand:+ start:175 stop:507 length:333 start_codon:yes stop_codon:yes gene_type:complete